MYAICRTLTISGWFVRPPENNPRMKAELPQFVRTVQKSALVGNIEF